MYRRDVFRSISDYRPGTVLSVIDAKMPLRISSSSQTTLSPQERPIKLG
jgi:hypothetical protein